MPRRKDNVDPEHFAFLVGISLRAVFEKHFKRNATSRGRMTKPYEAFVATTLKEYGIGATPDQITMAFDYAQEIITKSLEITQRKHGLTRLH